jgi:hypothetical protein
MTIKRIAHGKWHVIVGDRLIREDKTKWEAQEFAKCLALPGVFIDASDGYGDFSYFDEPDGSSANPPTPRRSCPTRRKSSSNTTGHIQRLRVTGSAIFFCSRISCASR